MEFEKGNKVEQPLAKKTKEGQDPETKVNVVATDCSELRISVENAWQYTPKTREISIIDILICIMNPLTLKT